MDQDLSSRHLFPCGLLRSRPNLAYLLFVSTVFIEGSLITAAHQQHSTLITGLNSHWPVPPHRERNGSLHISVLTSNSGAPPALASETGCHPSRQTWPLSPPATSSRAPTWASLVGRPNPDLEQHARPLALPHCTLDSHPFCASIVSLRYCKSSTMHPGFQVLAPLCGAGGSHRVKLVHL